MMVYNINPRRGVIQVGRIIEAHREDEADEAERVWQLFHSPRAWSIRIDNALWCYRQRKTPEEKRETVKYFADEFKRLGWSIPE